MTKTKMGKVFVIEGCDGVGKSRMVKRVSGFIKRSLKLPCKTASFPNNKGILYNQIRDKLKYGSEYKDILQQMMMINMGDYIERHMYPELLKGTNFICDRWVLSTLIYNRMENGILLYAFSDNKTKELNLQTMTKYICNGKDIKPSRIFYLTIPSLLLKRHCLDREEKNKAEINDKFFNVSQSDELYKKFYHCFRSPQYHKMTLEYLGIQQKVTLIDHDSKKRHVLIEGTSDKDLYSIISDKERLQKYEKEIYDDMYSKIIKQIKKEIL